jgi:hypothetical protein
MKELGHLVSGTGCGLSIGLVHEVVAGTLKSRGRERERERGEVRGV